MEPVRMMLVGCGMMGLRHIRGMAELERVAPGSVELAAVCDLREDAAARAADEAQQLLGSRPQTFTNIERALDETADLQAADVVTEPRSHDEIVIGLLEAGLDVICEKPLALTVARGRRMVEAARRTGQLLATAENNKRDPMNRLARAAIQAGLIGTPNFVLQVAIQPGGRVVATAWRHRLAMGGLLLDVAIHLGYTLEFLLGPVDWVSARAWQVEHEISGKEWDGREVAVPVDSEDAATALLGFESGASGHWTSHFASGGEAMFRRLVVGDEGTLDSPRGRSGKPVVVRRGSETLSGQALLDALPDFCLSDLEARLFGERPAEYHFETTETDRKLIAAEMGDFVEAVRARRQPESTGEDGLRAVALVYAMLESSLAGRPVTMAEVLGGSVHQYQDRVEQSGAAAQS